MHDGVINVGPGALLSLPRERERPYAPPPSDPVMWCAPDPRPQLELERRQLDVFLVASDSRLPLGTRFELFRRAT
jgi:hypothetical protein